MAKFKCKRFLFSIILQLANSDLYNYLHNILQKLIFKIMPKSRVIFD